MLDEHSWALAARAVDVAVRPAILTRSWRACRPELRPGSPAHASRTRAEVACRQAPAGGPGGHDSGTSYVPAPISDLSAEAAQVPHGAGTRLVRCNCRATPSRLQVTMRLPRASRPATGLPVANGRDAN